MNPIPPAHCPKCREPVPEDAPHGLCPACVGAGIGGRFGPDQTSFSLEFGPYDLLQQIGRGGAGVVFRARDRRSGEIVALKILTVGRFASPTERDRFAREAQLVATLDHPRIVPFVDVGEEEGQPYLAMRWIEGQSLTERALRALPPLTEAVRIVRQAAEAVGYAHAHGVIHRDLKPSNILVTPAGEVWVLDFGLAKWFGTPSSGAPGEQEPAEAGTPKRSTLTRTGEALGTPGYMPPEQCGGPQSTLGPASDVYALGSVLYFTLTGRPPFLAGTHHETILQLLRDDPVSLRRLNPAIPCDLETICLKCLEKEPARRYQTARDLADELVRFENDRPIQARPLGRPTRCWRWVRRNRAAAAVVTLIVALVTGFSWHNWRTVTELRNTAPALVALAESLMTAQKFPEALERVETALRLQPRNADYLALKGNIQQAMLRMVDAAECYRLALLSNPELGTARTNLILTRRVISARAPPGTYSQETLTQLFEELIRQGRSPEALAVSKVIDIAEDAFVARLQRHLGEAGITNELYWSMRRPAALRTTTAAEELEARSNRYLSLSLRGSLISDLSPLRGIPLFDLDLALCTNVFDLSPLRGMPLVHLLMVRGEVSDLSPIAGMPLEILWIGYNRVKDLGPLKTLSSLRELYMHNIDVGDISAIGNLPLEILHMSSMLVTRLEALRNLPLSELNITHARVTDLSPLAALPLRKLNLDHLPVSDLAPLSRLPLRSLGLSDCVLVRDLAPLRDCQQLEELTLPPNATNLSILRSLPKLQTINGLPVVQFLKGLDSAKEKP